MKVTYIHHSAFAVREKNKVFLFDYFLGELPPFEEDDEILVFASHKHPDHFSLDIFRLSEKYRNVTFFLANEIKLNEKYLERKGIDPSVKKRIISVKKHEKIEYNGITIETLDSTDTGVAFVVEYNGKTIYHAGDLNWWHWEEESGENNDYMAQKYRTEIDSLDGRHFDAAFVPVDPRLQSAYDYGICYFMERTDTKYVFPMHFWREYDIVEKLIQSERASSFADRVQVIRKEGDEWEL